MEETEEDEKIGEKKSRTRGKRSQKRKSEDEKEEI